MRLRPLNGHALLKPLESERTSAGGIVLPDTVTQDRHEGEVLALADDAVEDVAVGDRVVYKDLSAVKVTVDGEENVLVSSDDLLLKYLATDDIPE